MNFYVTSPSAREPTIVSTIRHIICAYKPTYDFGIFIHEILYL